MFYLKKFLSRFLFPLPFCAGLIILGLILISFKRFRRPGTVCAFIGVSLLLLFSYPLVNEWALGELENRYPPILLLESGNISTANFSKVYILVLSGSMISADTNRPPNSRIDDEGLQRIVEGVRLHKLLPGSTLLLSAPSAFISRSEKEQIIAELLLMFGVTMNKVQICDYARDTEDELRWCKNVVGTNRVIIVSSAYHLPRAMIIANRLNLNAIAAPSGYYIDKKTKEEFNPSKLFPDAQNLKYSERAIYEYLGIVYEKLRRSRNATVHN